MFIWSTFWLAWLLFWVLFLSRERKTLGYFWLSLGPEIPKNSIFHTHLLLTVVLQLQVVITLCQNVLIFNFSTTCIALPTHPSLVTVGHTWGLLWDGRNKKIIILNFRGAPKTIDVIFVINWKTGMNYRIKLLGDWRTPTFRYVFHHCSSAIGKYFTRQQHVHRSKCKSEILAFSQYRSSLAFSSMSDGILSKRQDDNMTF